MAINTASRLRWVSGTNIETRVFKMPRAKNKTCTVVSINDIPKDIVKKFKTKLRTHASRKGMPVPRVSAYLRAWMTRVAIGLEDLE